MDSRVGPGALVLGLLVLLLVLMYLGWRTRRRRQRDIPHPLAVPDDAGAQLLSIDLLYVASTMADAPLDRIAVQGLGFRSRAEVVVRAGGLELRLAGEPDAFVPAGDIREVSRATWTIDRVVETDGLVRLAWTLGDTDIDSYFRVTEPADPSGLIAAIRAITVTSAEDTPTHDSRTHDSPTHDSPAHDSRTYDSREK
ncbi:MAG: hypothetical protein RI885_1978 [Actinomycetota bacterium]